MVARASGSCCPRAPRSTSTRPKVRPTKRRTPWGEPTPSGRAGRAPRGALTAEELLAGLSAPWIEPSAAELEDVTLRAQRDPGARVASRSIGHRRRARRAPDSSNARRTASRPTACSWRRSPPRATSPRPPWPTTACGRYCETSSEPRPTPAIVALHDRLIAPDAAPEAASARPRLPLASRAPPRRPFVARGDERARVDAAWEAAPGGRRPRRHARGRAWNRQDEPRSRLREARPMRREPRCCSAAAIRRRWSRTSRSSRRSASSRTPCCGSGAEPRRVDAGVGSRAAEPSRRRRSRGALPPVRRRRQAC